MARYTQESIEGLRDAIDMVALVSKETDLRRVGTRWTGLCPFHEERTPSFSVNAEEKLFHCFGCQKGGDAIGFVMETEGLDFPEAVEALADRFGVELKREREDPQEEERRKRRERLLALLERTTGFYATFLWEAPEAKRARDYLAGRGLGEEVLRAFRVGYAPKAWDRVLTGARQGGFSEAELLASRPGEPRAQRQPARPLPRADHVPAGRQPRAGCSASAHARCATSRARSTSTPPRTRSTRRAASCSGSTGRGPRSPRRATPWWWRATPTCSRCTRAGVEEAVGIMGTAVTQEQVAELARGVGADGRVSIALDADRSGQEAMLRAAKIARERAGAAAGRAAAGGPRSRGPGAGRGRRGGARPARPLGVCA